MSDDRARAPEARQRSSSFSSSPNATIPVRPEYPHVSSAMWMEGPGGSSIYDRKTKTKYTGGGSASVVEEMKVYEAASDAYGMSCVG